MHDARAALDERVDLRDRGLGIGEREHRRRDQAVVVREAPVVLEPPVERGEAGHRRGDVVLERLLDAAPERGEQQRGIEALLVGDGDARVAVAVLGAQRLDLHQRRPGSTPFGDLAAEERVEAAGDDDRVEGRVRDEAVDALADEQLHVLLAVVHRAHAAPLERGIEVPGERIERLVVVVVGVDGVEIHPASILRRRM